MDVVDIAQKELKLIDARKHLEAGDEHGKRGDLASASDEFGKGIELLKAGGAAEVLDLMAELYISRASADNAIAMSRLNDGRESPSAIEERCRRIVKDCTAVLDLPKHASPKQIRDAQCLRVSATSFFVASLKVKVSESDIKVAQGDIREVLTDPYAEETQISIVKAAKKYLGGGRRHTVDDSSIKPSFLTLDDLKQAEGLNIGIPGHPRIQIARSFVDKSGPINMSDGTAKQLPPGVAPLDRIISLSPAQLNSQFGRGAGTFFGEVLFWKKHGGVLLGKQKWEAEGEMMTDTATASEIWDMRWVFKTSEDAKGFYADMLAASKAEDGNGFLDGKPELSLKPGERALLSPDIDSNSFALYASYPKKKPRNMDPRSSLGAAHMFADPPSYLQQYGAVFVVDRVVVKLFVIEGFNQKSGPLKRSALLAENGLVNRTVKTIQEWLDGTRTGFQHGGEAADKSSCANCGKKSSELKQCSRCKAVAYCSRDCQVAHYKVHKKPCLKIASSG